MSADRTVVLPPALQAAKNAFKALTQAVGGQAAAAVETGKSQSRICNYGLTNTDEFAPIDVVRALEAVTHGQPGHPHVTRWLAREAGYVLVAIPSTDLPETIWSQRIAAALREVGALSAGIGDALSDDNDVSQEEAKRLLDEADANVEAAVTIREAIKRRAEGLG